MKLQAFVDDSRTGDANQPGGVFTLAGYVASESEWSAFPSEWQAELNNDPKIDAFKMSHFSNRFGPWNDRLQLFRNIIERHARGAMTITVELDVYRRFAGSIPIRDPYYIAFMDLIIQVKRAAPYIEIHDEIEFIFDEQMTEKRHIKYAWEGLKTTRPDIANFLGGEPKRVSDKDFLPIQAADKLGWWTRRLKEELIAGKPQTPSPWTVGRIVPQIMLELDDAALTNILGHHDARQPT
jgi:uncharacterized protein DUF3800